MTSPRLLAITTSREEGGAESHLRITLAAASARGYAVHVALPRCEATARLWADLRGSGFELSELTIGREGGSRLAAYAMIARDFVRTLRAISAVRPQTILLSLPTPEATPGAMLACALSRVRTTAIFHLVRSDLRVTRARGAMYRLIARCRQRWVCVSADNATTLSRQFGVARSRVTVVRNGVEQRMPAGDCRERLRAELGVPAEGTLVLTTGRLGAQKDHAVIVAALPRLIELDPGLVFAWAGDGPLRAQLQAALVASGLERHVRMLGRRDDVPELLAASDVFLLPSRDEGSPLALAEAMAAGVAAVVSDAGALTEMITDGESGVVFARGDADDLVRAITWALEHRERLAQMAARARDRAATELSFEAMLAELMALIAPLGELHARADTAGPPTGVSC